MNIFTSPPIIMDPSIIVNPLLIPALSGTIGTLAVILMFPPAVYIEYIIVKAYRRIPPAIFILANIATYLIAVIYTGLLTGFFSDENLAILYMIDTTLMGEIIISAIEWGIYAAVLTEKYNALKLYGYVFTANIASLAYSLAVFTSSISLAYIIAPMNEYETIPLANLAVNLLATIIVSVIIAWKTRWGATLAHGKPLAQP